MYKLQTTLEDVQEQSFSLYSMNLRLTLRYNIFLKAYQFDLFDLNSNEFIVQSKGLTIGSPALIDFDVPFVLSLSDKSRLNLNSINQSDFANRLELLIMTKEEYHEAIRSGYTA